jgi:hypothetical protein
MARGVDQWRVQTDEIGAGQKLVEGHLLDPQFRGPVLAQVGVEGDDPHFQPLGPVGDHRSDIAAADDAQHLARDLDPHEAGFFPLPGMGRGIGQGNVAGQGQQHGDGVLRRGDGIAERRVHHHDALGRGRVQIDIVDADPGTADDLQIFGGLDNRAAHLGRRTHGQAVIVPDDGRQVLGRQARFHVHFDPAALEDLRRKARHFVGNQHSWHDGFRP